MSAVQSDRSHRRPRVLVLAFACNPATGSEPGAGWGVVQALASVADLTVLVPPHEFEKIEVPAAECGENLIRFIEVPGKEADHGLLERLGCLDRRLWFLRYLLWLKKADRVCRQLHAERPFEATVHATYGCYWLPTPLRHVDTPLMWGPVGGATRTPFSLYRYLGWRGIVGEWQKIIMLRLLSLLPSVRQTWHGASVILVETENSRRALPESIGSRVRLINRAPLASVPKLAPVPRKGYLLFPSLLEGRKGPRLALTALARTPSAVRLVIVSGGYEESALRRMARRLGVSDRVEFRGRVPRQEMFAMMNEAAAVVFTGLREEGGMALAEAMSMGAPVIVLAIGGAEHIARQGTDPSRLRLIEPSTADETARRFAETMTEFCTHPPSATGPYLSPGPTSLAIQEALRDTLARGAKEAAVQDRESPS